MFLYQRPEKCQVLYEIHNFKHLYLFTYKTIFSKENAKFIKIYVSEQILLKFSKIKSELKCISCNLILRLTRHILSIFIEIFVCRKEEICDFWFFCSRYVQNEWSDDFGNNVRPPVCQFPAYTSARAFLLATLPILLSEEHPVFLLLPGKVGNYPISHPQAALSPPLLRCVQSCRIPDPTQPLVT